METIETPKGKTLYLNSGDWIENLTALEYNNKKWKIHKYNPDDYLSQEDEQEFDYQNKLADQFMSILK